MYSGLGVGTGVMTIFKNMNELEQYLRGLNPNYNQYAKNLWTNGVTSISQLGNASPATLVACGIKSPLHAEDSIAQSKGTVTSSGTSMLLLQITKSADVGASISALQACITRLHLRPRGP